MMMMMVLVMIMLVIVTVMMKHVFSSERQHGRPTFTANVVHDDSVWLEIVCSVAPRVL